MLKAADYFILPSIGAITEEDKLSVLLEAICERNELIYSMVTSDEMNSWTFQ